MDANAIAKALRCGNTIGGSCYAACKYRENGLCELTESQLRINAATLIETIAAENARLRAERDKAVEDMEHIANKIQECHYKLKGDVDEVSSLHLGRCDVCAGICHDGSECKFEWSGTEGKA